MHNTKMASSILLKCALDVKWVDCSLQTNLLINIQLQSYISRTSPYQHFDVIYSSAMSCFPHKTYYLQQLITISGFGSIWHQWIKHSQNYFQSYFQKMLYLSQNMQKYTKNRNDKKKNTMKSAIKFQNRRTEKSQSSCQQCPPRMCTYLNFSLLGIFCRLLYEYVCEAE